MKFSIAWSSEAMRVLVGLERAIAQRVVQKLEEAAQEPTHFFQRLEGRPEWKLRVGDYRIIAHVDFRQNRIFVATLGHRKNIYK